MHRYVLEKYKTPASRYDCPSCGERKNFSRYLDTETGEHLHPSAGRCNREINCGYHYTPKQYFQDNRHLLDTKEPRQYRVKQVQTPQPKPISYFPFETFEKSLRHHRENNFVKFLCALFGMEITKGLIEKYFIGTSKRWNRATVFWQIDISGKLRTGKIMLYNPITGKRVKEPFNHITWVHKILGLENYRQCFFGEHLLNLPENKGKPVAIFESEKTAVIASVYFPDFVCLAAGGADGLNIEKCNVLKKRNVILYPDVSKPRPGRPTMFDRWNKKAKELSRLFPGTRFNVSDLTERKATESERQQGLDLADYLIRFDYKAFQKAEQTEPLKQNFEQPQQKETKKEQEIKPCKEKNYFISINQEEKLKPETWDQDIAELERFFKTAALPTVPVKLTPDSTITNVSLFIHSHLATVKANNGKRTFLPYLEKLRDLKQYLIVNTN